ncbi:MAG: NmrA family NAD(P)-binding protein [Gemmatimonadaceae bacterium]|nr:NmrA family NAD(P)-binding protein [Gemmatimonadaceae bacterium]
MLLQSKPPVLVTGATGNVGRTVVRTLLDAGVPVRALAAAPDAVPSRLGFSSPLLSVVAFDFERPKTYAAAFDGGAAMFLLRPPAIGDASVLSRAVDAAHEQGVSHVAFLSIQGAEKNPLVPHHAIERHLKAIASKDRSFSYVLLRAAFFMQNLSGTHAADIREHDEILVPAGDGRTAFVDARDVGAAAAHVLLDRADAPSARRAYDLTGRDALSYDEVAAILSQVCGRTIRYRHPSLLRFYRAMRGRGHPRGFIMVMMALYSTARMGLAAQLSNDLEELLGRPPISLRQFAQDMVEAFRPQASELTDSTLT